ncbi:MAG: hypothetical protein DMG13_15020 [Acidobacteria bacterium]|nr:MAG: hypothetical protein DMG13_15020 [Acidobacteriota bacterium]
MRRHNHRAVPGVGLGLITLLSALLGTSYFLAADTLPREITDDAFWQMVSDFSEGGGSFRFEFMSNELEFQSVIPALKKTTKPGGAYLGVGPEQNFTYIAAVQPKIAFVTDIRRENMLEHLIYKAVFEMSSDRADFVSRLFSRKASPGLNDNPTVKALFQAYRTAEPDAQLFSRNLQAVKDRLMKDHRFRLTSEDQTSIDYIYRTIFNSGTGFNYSGGFGGFRGVSYADLMTATDDEGQPRSYLANEENFQFVRQMERKNLIVPLVGDFAGPTALRKIGQYLKKHGASVTAFYTSNVEQYLFQQGDDWRHFYQNAAALPIDSSSAFIRSSHFAYDTGTQSFKVLRRGNFLSLLCPMPDLLKAFNEGRLQSYDQVIRMSN